MEIIKQLDDWQCWRLDCGSDVKIGLVPTMGCLHAGHQALLQQAHKDCDIVVLSIYVNPTQFNDSNDYACYPQTLEEDLALAREAGVAVVLLPTTDQMYGQQRQFRVECDHFWAGVAEGAARPGHFSGALTIVLKLLGLVRPARVYFGEKDYQQLQLVTAMVAGLFVDTKVIAVPTHRELSGLPLSSRNIRLDAEQRVIAEQFAAIFAQVGKVSLSDIEQQLQELPLHLEYLQQHRDRVLVAVKIGDIRLIDNRELITVDC